MLSLLSLFLFGPRAAVVIWWIRTPPLEPAFSSWLWPVIGFFIAPWTTLMWVICAPGGVRGLDYLWIGLAIAFDVATWSGAASPRSTVGRHRLTSHL